MFLFQNICAELEHLCRNGNWQLTFVTADTNWKPADFNDHTRFLMAKSVCKWKLVIYDWQINVYESEVANYKCNLVIY